MRMPGVLLTTAAPYLYMQSLHYYCMISLQYNTNTKTTGQLNIYFSSNVCPESKPSKDRDGRPGRIRNESSHKKYTPWGKGSQYTPNYNPQ